MSMTVEEAFAEMHSKVHTPAFFSKLASFDLAPRTEEEEEMLILIGQQFISGREAGLVKESAAPENEFLSEALQELNSYLTPQDAQTKAAAIDQFVADVPEMKTAVLTLEHALRQTAA